MIANVNKNNSKLVAAIVAMAMIVCAIAVQTKESVRII